MNYFYMLFAKEKGLCPSLFETLFAKATSDKLPSGYRKVKSLTMNNDCYYEIPDLYLKGSDTLKFSCSITSTCNALGSYSGSSSGPNYSVYASTSNVSYLRYGSNNYNSQFDADTRYNVTITPTGSHGMKHESTWEEAEFTTTRPFCIGTTASAITTSAKMKGTFFGNIIVKDANGIRFKGIPCVRESDDVAGYYDIVSETFYEPVGTSPTPA